MFDSNARVDNSSGIRFYERDVIKTRKILNSSSIISIDFDYKSTGIGFAIIPVNPITKQEENRCYLFRIGTREFTCDLFSQNTKRRLSQGTFLSSKKSNSNLTLEKNKEEVKLLFDGEEVFKIKLGEEVERYKLGIYSSEGNVVKEVRVKTKTPKNWSTNMMNTDGGQIEFEECFIFVSGCKDNMEFIQDDIPISEGKYYLKYEESNNNNLKVIVYQKDDSSVPIEDKNILEEDNSFTIEEDTQINVAVVGKSGYIGNLSISTSEDEKFVIPKEGDIKSEHSDIKIDSRGLNRLFLVFEVLRRNSPQDDPHFIFLGKDVDIKLEDIEEISTRKKYVLIVDFKEDVKVDIYEEIDIEDYNIFENYEKYTPIYTNRFAIERYLSIFSNIDTVISYMIVNLNNGEKFNPITRKEVSKIVSINNDAPITMYSRNEPLDLSSSYRLSSQGEWPPIKTTNVEREIFKSSRILMLEKEPSKLPGTIKVYAIKENANVETSKLLNGTLNGDVSEYTKNFHLYEDSSFEVDYGKRMLVFDKFFDYDHLIVDYLKNNSFCINKMRGSNSFKIDAYFEDNDAEIIKESSPYNRKVTNINIDENRYVILNKMKEVVDFENI